MGSKLRKASREAVKRYEEGDDFLVCRTELTRGEMNELLRLLPQNVNRIEGERPDKETIAQGALFLEAFFEIVVRAWSLEEPDGTATPVGIEQYKLLTFEGSQFVDNILNQHLLEIMGQKNAEGESTS